MYAMMKSVPGGSIPAVIILFSLRTCTLILFYFLLFSQGLHQYQPLVLCFLSVCLPYRHASFCFLLQYMGGGPEPPLPLGAQEAPLVMNGKREFK